MSSSSIVMSDETSTEQMMAEPSGIIQTEPMSSELMQTLPEEIEEDSGFQTSAEMLFSPQDTLQSHVSSQPRRVTKEPDAMTVNVTANTDFDSIDVPVVCEVCSLICLNGRAFLAHMESHENMDTYSCSYCSKEFAHIHKLQAHMIEHGADKQFECAVCHQHFSRRDSVRVHLRIHDKSKCVYCTVCQKPFLTEGALGIHMRIHRGEKPFNCHVCGKCFTQKCHLLNHYKMHELRKKDTFPSLEPQPRKLGTRVFQCQHCARSFVRLSDFERHVQWNHNVLSDSPLVVNPNNMSNDKTTTMTTLTQSLFPRSRNRYESLRNQPVSQVPQKKTLCTTATQTDEDTGYVIIPRKYQTSENQHQLFQPQTPRPDEDHYEMFDEGMDRNLSSDEDDYPNVDSDPPMPYTSTSVTTATTASSTANDDVFDAVRTNTVPNVPLTDQPLLPAAVEPNTTKEEVPVVTIHKQQHEFLATPTEEEISKAAEALDAPIDQKSYSNVIRSRNIEKAQSKGPMALSKSFNMSNWQGKTKGKPPRTRIKPKTLLGLTGPAHLRLIRKSLQTFITNKKKPEAVPTESEEQPCKSPQTATEKNTTKRTTKAKQHRKDFICSSKSCTLCQPQAELPVAESETIPKTPPVPEKKIGEGEEKSERLLQFLLSGDASTLQGTDIKLLSQSHSYSSLSRHETQQHASETTFETNDTTAVMSSDSFVIPTYSCKLCNREFRFEGKLHRHIELVHHHKYALAAPKRRATDSQEAMMSKAKKQALNPELAALKSDWDDEDEDAANHSQPQSPQHSPPQATASSQQIKARYQYATGGLGNKLAPPPAPPVATNVRVNFNKFSAINHQRPLAEATPEPVLEVRPQHTPTDSTLEQTTHKLLEKLFSMRLLLKCGFLDEHVSVVLGKVLQYYGVKMIEDYGQGQYEVLKYNLWRLIEWKVTMEQMEEFYSAGKSVEEMMTDILYGRVPIISHIEPTQAKQEQQQQHTNTVDMGNNQLVVSQVTDLLAGEISLGDGMTQVVISQDMVSPEMLQGAHIVTLDATTGQVLSQVTADQVILTSDVTASLGQQIQTIDNGIVVSHAPTTGSIVTSDGSIHISASNIQQGGEEEEMSQATTSHDMSC